MTTHACRHPLHATVDVLEIAAAFAVGSAAPGVESLLQFSTVSTAWCAAAGNVAARELVERHCFEDDDDDRVSAHDETCGRPVLALAGTASHPSDSGDDGWLRLDLAYNKWHRRFPAHTAALLLALRGNGAQAQRLARIRTLSVTYMDEATPANARAFHALLRLLQRFGECVVGAALLTTVRCLQLTQDAPEKSCKPRFGGGAPPLTGCDVLRVVDMLDTRAVEFLDVQMPVTATPIEVAALLSNFPRLMSLRLVAPAATAAAAPIVPPEVCPLLEWLHVDTRFTAVTGATGATVEAVVAMVRELPQRRPSLRVLSVLVANAESTGVVLETLAASVADGAAIALERVAVSAGWGSYNSAFAAPFTSIVTALPHMRRCGTDKPEAHGLINNVVADVPRDVQETFAYDQLQATLGEGGTDLAQFRETLARLPNLTSIAVFCNPSDADLYDAVAATIADYPPGRLRRVVLGTDASRDLVAAPAASVQRLLERHGATLRALAVPASMLPVAALAHAPALDHNGSITHCLSTCKVCPEATWPGLTCLYLTEMHVSPTFDDIVARFIDNDGQNRVAVREIFFVGLDPRLLVAVARRCPNTRALALAGDIPTSVVLEALQALPRLRSLNISQPRPPGFAQWLALLRRPDVPQLTKLLLPPGLPHSVSGNADPTDDFVTTQPHLTSLL